MPDPSLFSELDVEGVDVAEMPRVMNARIELLYDREHALGHAYLMDLMDKPTVECLQAIFRDKIMPLLQEYFYDDYSKISSVLGAASGDFIEVRGSENVFWSHDENAYGSLRSYRLKPTPDDASAYRRIYHPDDEA
jgi:5-methylcytosine-specific restriction protein B